MHPKKSIIDLPPEIEIIGIFSDVHGDYLALDRLIEKRYDIQRWFCAGDAIDQFLPDFDNQPVLRILNKFNIFSVMGNHEHSILKSKIQNYDIQNQEFLRNIPFSLTLTFFSKLKILIFHSTPESPMDVLKSSYIDERYIETFKNINTDIIVFGHSHEAFIKNINNKQYVNPGYLGRIGDNSSYATIHNSGYISINYIE